MASSEQHIGSAVSLPPAGTDPDASPRAPDTLPLIDRLAGHRTLGRAPRVELTWLAAHGHLERFEAGEVVSTPATPIGAMFVLLSGRLSIHLVRGGTRHKVAEWAGGDVTGLLPYSRLTTPPGDTVVDETVEALVVDRAALPALARECHEITSLLVHVMLDRARFFTSTVLHDEKLRSLGKLAAGLAHELNNPAAAIKRSARMLPQSFEAAESAARAIGSAGLTASEQEAVARMRDECLAAPVTRVRSPLEEAEREEVIAGWLEAQGVEAGAAAEVLAQTPVTLTALDHLVGSIRRELLAPVLRWVAANCALRGLAAEIEQAASRISDLVTAVRGFTQVDQSAAPQPVRIREGLEQTLAVLKAKARARSVSIDLDVAPDLPPVRGVAAELNQIWANLIDNALDAAPESGRVEVLAHSEKGSVVVRVKDNGPGIPPEIRDRVFDPFFTTKDIGKGTGLGLDIVRRLIDRHDGDIEVRSEPGRTEFIVSLPAASYRDNGRNP
ncbi:MAG: ATP-binding protein [Vicinamibacterales bacterium]